MENDSGEFEESHDLRNDEDDEFNFGGSPDYYNNMSTDLAQTQVLHNQRADEAVELSDQDNSMDESIISAVANIPPRPSSQLAHNRPSNSSSSMKLPPRSFQEAITTFEDEEEESHAPINVSKVRSTIPDRSLQPYQRRQQEVHDYTEDPNIEPPIEGLELGPYNSDDFVGLNVSTEIATLFGYISLYQPIDIEVETFMKPFIPDYIPSIGDLDSFVKIPRPDFDTGSSAAQDTLGWTVLDEPAAVQADATALDLFLRLHVKQSNLAPITVRNIEFADRHPKKVQAWINNIAEIHKQKPAPNVMYKNNMPDVEQLMQAWPEEMEEALKSYPLPDPDINMSLVDYAKLCCALLDIPIVNNNIIESLHVMFTLYSEIQNTHQFQS